MNGPGVFRCGRCGREVAAGGHYCLACGAPLAAPTGVVCPHCGARSEGDGCCPSCGLPLAVRAARPRRRGGALAAVVAVAAVALVVILAFNVLGPILDPPANPDYAMGTGTMEYSWEDGGRTFRLQVDIPNSEYQQYHQEDIPRAAHSFSEMISLAKRYVTSHDEIIRKMAASFNQTASDLHLSRAATAELVLSFVQNIPYVEDSASTLHDEYWRFPVETLHDKEGDCEDKVFLFDSIVEAMGYDAVALFFEGHAAAGIDLEGVSGARYQTDGKYYYYCETTADGWGIGEIPSQFGAAYVAQVG